jgi:hypothetical protein
VLLRAEGVAQAVEFLSSKCEVLSSNLITARHWWFMPIILTTQAEIRRIEVQSQLGQIVHETLTRKKPITKKGWQSGSR